MPVAAVALSLGDIDLKSALNQPFSAEIPVATDSEHELASLNVGLASIATFEQYGLERVAFIGDFRFEIVPAGANGIVRITSREPVVEPFVTLLLEISWPSGRLLREYTVLLDPPVFAAEAAAPVVAAPTAGPAPGPTRVVRPAPQESSARPAPAPAPRTATPAPRAPAPTGGSYGPVQRNDTLWGIAGRYAEGAGIQRNQMMMAIYRANPEAFIGNINRLKAGMILRVPDADELQRLSSGEATAEVRRQNQDWRGATQEDAGTLRLVPPPDAGEEMAQAGTGTGDRGVAADASGAELRGRVEQLERELAESRRLIELRDEQLQNLQQQARQGDQAVLPGVEEPPPVEEVPGEGELVAEQPIAGEPGVEEPATEESVAQEPEQVVPVTPPVVTTPPVAEKSFISGLLTNIWLYVGIGVALILALFVVRRRSAEPEAPPWGRFDDEGLAGEEVSETTQQLSASPAADTSFVVEESVGERTDQDQVPYAPDEGVDVEFGTDQDIAESPLERTISTESPVNLDEADPIAEAEFHMAYGLYDQAADLLSNSLNAEPERNDLRLKLLEVYFIWENQGGFLREAQELNKRIEDPSDADWNKVLIMGKQLCPEEGLFSATPSVVGGAGEMDLAFGDEGDAGSADSLDFDFSESGADDGASFDDADGGLDFDLSVDDLGAGDAADDGLDFDISEAEEATLVAADEDLNDAPTMETPTMESPIQAPSDDDSAATMETPTIESAALETTMETPTVESAALETTMETPTVESAALETTMETPTVESEALETTMETPTIESEALERTMESPIARPDEAVVASDQTAEIELDDLGLDLSDLEGAGVADIAAEIGSADGDDDGIDLDDAANLAAETLQVEIDSLEAFDEDTQQHKMTEADLQVDDELIGIVDVEATGEMPSLGDTAEQPVVEETLEQPGIGGGDTAEQPDLAALSGATAEAMIEPGDAGAEVDFEVGDAFADSDATTSVVPTSTAVADGATMTEVGTKLDLARAYIDMGDPDGARSILNEVLEEATDDQRQEAQKLLDDLED
jgi:pilus assembly protein FimV